MLIFLLQFVCLSIQAQPRETSSTITIRESSISVGEVLAEITRQSGLDFSFNETVVNPDQLISFSVSRASLEKTLEVLAKK